MQSHFNYCPLIWMFSFRRSNNLINRIHERSLRTFYNDTGSTFQELLQCNRSVSIHHKNIQALTTEWIRFALQSWINFLISGKTDTISENFKKWDSKKLELSDMVSKQLFIALLNYDLLFLQIKSNCLKLIYLNQK